VNRAEPGSPGERNHHIWRLLSEEDPFAYRLRYLGRRPRLVIALAVAVAAAFLQPESRALETRLLVAFDLGVTLHLAAVWFMMARSTVQGMSVRARVEDERKWTVLTLGAASTVAVLVAIGLELHGARANPGGASGVDIALAVVTIVLAWVFMNTLFALHYAHAYYAATEEGEAPGGLLFPGEDEPDYWDFVYFSFVIGMTFQVSDVQITRGTLRRLVAAHGVLAFFFNVGILALVINIAAGKI
jgi:uncharacterized membrane protein